jgi:hypothetical protein
LGFDQLSLLKETYLCCNHPSPLLQMELYFAEYVVLNYPMTAKLELDSVSYSKREDIKDCQIDTHQV